MFFYRDQEATFGTFGPQEKKMYQKQKYNHLERYNSLSGERQERELKKIMPVIQAGFFRTLVLRSIRCSSLFLCSKGLKVLLKSACFTPSHLLNKTKKGCLSAHIPKADLYSQSNQSCTWQCFLTVNTQRQIHRKENNSHILYHTLHLVEKSAENFTLH